MICKFKRQMSHTSKQNAEKEAATREWIERQQHLDCVEIEDDISSLAESSILSSSDGDYETEALLDTSTNVTAVVEKLCEVLNSINSIQTLENVHIENSSNVRIGNVTNINGNIQIIQRIKKRIPKIDRLASTSSSTSQTNVSETLLATEAEEQEERVKRDAFIERVKYKIPKEVCAVIPRSTWLAQRPMEEYDLLPVPVNLVIISHTATESSEKQAINVRIIRDIQCFHIESREWNDIAYNFLVGCDGNVYEGRGWGVVGAHTIGYNTKSIGIAFIGCFMRELPSEAAMNACKNFLKRGVEEGHLAPDYKLTGHCQCRSTESPGRKLFEELQTWNNFYNIGEEIDKE